VSAGPVTITTDPLAIAVAGTPLTGFIAIGTVAHVDDHKYYDPRDLAAVTWQRPARATGVDDDWLELEGGARLRVVAGAVDASAAIELDASAVENAVLAQVALTRAPTDPIYGFGESFAGADAAGQVREAQFRPDFEVESSLNEAHVPVPLALWPRAGVGLFVEDRRPGAFDAGATDPSVVAATFTLPVRGPYRAHVFTTAPDRPLELVERYVALTAKPAVPPRWAFAPMQWRNEHASADEVRDDADTMRALGIPDTTMWIDNPWQTGYNTFVFDETRIAEPGALIAELTAKGYKVLLWSTPYVNTTGPTAADYAEAVSNRYLVTDDVGLPLPVPWANGPGGLVDFAAPGAIDWWRERIRRVVDLGVRGFKLDFGEEVVPELGGNLAPFATTLGDAQVSHGIYQRGYHDAYLGALPAGDAFLLTRAGAWGDQDRNTAIWPGDLDNDFTRHGGPDGEDGLMNVGGLPAAIAGGLSLSVSGYPFYGSDIGGFRNGTPDTEVLIRWAQYAALGTIMQLGGAGPSHNPWDTTLYDPPALAVYTEYARLHMDLNPYLWTLALAAGERGTPVTRPAGFVGGCPACDGETFLLGDAILVAPVVEAGATTRDVVIPDGAWRDWWTGELVTGDGTTSRTVPAPLVQMPVWQRVGSIVPMFARAADTLAPATAPGVTSYADPAYGRELRLRIASGAVAATAQLHDGGAAEVTPGASLGLAYTAGGEYDIITFDVHDGELAAPTDVSAGATPLPAVASEAALAACASPGCYLSEGERLRIRLFARDADAVAVTF
jgi:alpha-D-xyloside xylohydrolase